MVKGNQKARGKENTENKPKISREENEKVRMEMKARSYNPSKKMI